MSRRKVVRQGFVVACVRVWYIPGGVATDKRSLLRRFGRTPLDPARRVGRVCASNYGQVAEIIFTESTFSLGDIEAVAVDVRVVPVVELVADVLLLCSSEPVIST